MTTEPVYHIDTLMQETRRIAAQYRISTGQTLPLSNDLARYDCQKLFKLKQLIKAKAGIDFVGSKDSPWPGEFIQIKSRLIDPAKPKANIRLGQIAINSPWERLILVLYETDYEPHKIFTATKIAIEADLAAYPQAAQQKKGGISVSRFIKLAEQLS